MADSTDAIDAIDASINTNIEGAFNIKEPASGMAYGSSKTYCHNQGLSCCFRQWRAESHCRFLHGYALQVRLEFQAVWELDHRNWAVDFGSLKSLKGWLEDLLDHKTLVAEDDPKLGHFQELDSLGLIQLRVVPSVGVEAIARMIFEYTTIWLKDNGYNHVTLIRVSVNEHEANGAWYGKRVL